MTATPELTHSFSRAQAKLYGVHGALLLRYVINRIRASTNIRDGKRWFYDSIADLTENYAYLSQTAIFNARKVLIANTGPLITGNYNKWKQDKTTWYAVRDDRTLQAPEDDLLYFRASEAVAYGILEAVILNNLRYWLEEKQKANPAYQYHRMSPRNLEAVFQQAFSDSSIRRALRHLVELGVLVPQAPETANNSVAYRFAGPEDEVGHESASSESGVLQDSGRASSETTPASTETIAASPESKGASSESEVLQLRSEVLQPRTTIPINNSLKGDCLKDCLEVCLKEDRFKASLVGDSSNSLPEAATLTLEAAGEQSRPNAFVESIARSLSAFPVSSASVSAFNAFVESIAATSNSICDPPLTKADQPVFAPAQSITGPLSQRNFQDLPY
jgi:hypothetical protein